MYHILCIIYHFISYQSVFFTIPLYIDTLIMSCHITYHLLHIISWNVSFDGYLSQSKLRDFHTFTESFTDIQLDLDKYIWPPRCVRDQSVWNNDNYWRLLGNVDSVQWIDQYRLLSPFPTSNNVFKWLVLASKLKYFSFSTCCSHIIFQWQVLTTTDAAFTKTSLLTKLPSS